MRRAAKKNMWVARRRSSGESKRRVSLSAELNNSGNEKRAQSRREERTDDINKSTSGLLID